MAQDMPVETKKRGWALSLLLVLMTFGSCGFIWFAYLYLMALLGLPYHPLTPAETVVPIERYIGPATPTWYPVAIVVIYVLNVVFLIAVWRWKKWGVFGFYAAWFASVVAAALAVDFSTVISAIFRPLIPLTLLGFLVSRKWRFFE